MSREKEVDAASTPKRPVRRRRGWRWLRRSIGLAAVLLLAALLGRQHWLPGLIEKLVPWASERVLPFRLAVDEVLAADYDHLSVRGLRMEAVIPDEALRRLTAREIEADLSIPRLVGGDLFRAFRNLRVLDAELELDLTRGAEPDPSEEPKAPNPPPVDLPRLALVRTRIDLTFSAEARATAAIQSLASTDGERFRLDARDVELHSPSLPLEVRHLLLAASYSEGVFSDIDLNLDGEPRAVDSVVDLSRAAREGVSWQLELRPTGGPARVEGGSTRRGVELDVTATGVQLASILALLPDAPHDVAARVDLRSRLTIPPAGFLRGRVTADLTARDVVVGDVALDSVATELRLANGRVSAPRLHARAGENELELTDAAFEVGALEDETPSLAALLDHSRGELRVRIDEPLRLVVPPDETSRRFLASLRTQLAARMSPGRIDVSRLSLDSASARVELEPSAIELRPGSPPFVRVALELDVDSLPTALSLLGWSDCAGSLSGRVTAAGTWPTIEGAVALKGEGIEVLGIDVGALMLAADYDAERVRLSSLRTQSASQSSSASGAWDRVAGRIEDALIRIDCSDLSRVLPGSFEKGQLTLDVRADGPLDELGSRLSLRGQDLGLAGLPPIELTVAAQGLGRRIALEELAVRTGTLIATAAGEVELDARLRPQELRVHSLAFDEGARRLLALERPSAIRVEPGLMRLDELALTGELGSLNVEGRREGDTARLHLDAIELRPMQILQPFLPDGWWLGHMDARLDATLGSDALVLSTEGSLRDVRIPALALPAEFAWQIDQTASRCDIGGVYASVGDALVIDLYGELPLQPASSVPLGTGPLDLHLRLDARSFAELFALDAELPRAEGELGVDIDLSGDARRVRGSVHARSDALRAAVVGKPDFELGELDALVVLDEAVALDHLHVGSAGSAPPLELDARGALLRPLDLHALLAESDAWACSTPAELEAMLDVADITRVTELLAMVGIEDLPLHAGSLRATVGARGSLADPNLRARVEMHEGALRLGPDLPAPSRIEAAAELDGGELLIESASGELGGAPFELAGAIDVSGPTPRFDLELRGEDLLLHRSRGVQVRADARLTIDGPLDALLVAGEIDLADSRYVRNFEIDLTRRGAPTSGARGLGLFRLSEPPLATMRFDVRVSSKQPFEIKNTTVSGAVRPDLRLAGTGEVPVLTGPIYVDPTTLSLPGSTLKIDSGTIQFREEDPFMPALALRGGARVRGYDIQIVVSGTLAAPEIVLSSNPPLPDDELLLLVTTGQVPVDGEAASASETARVVAIYLAKDFLARWLSDESTESEESLLSRFEVVTGQDVSASGADTIWASFRVAKGVLTDQDKLYLTAERDEYDFFNYGVRIVFRFE